MDFAKDLPHAIVSAPADAVVAADREGIIRLWNPGAVRIFGHLADEALGQSLDLIIPESLQGRHWEGYRRAMESGQSRYSHGDLVAVPGIRKDGRRISLEFTIVPLKDGNGRMEGVAAVMRDVTERFEEIKVLRRKVAEAIWATPDSVSR